MQDEYKILIRKNLEFLVNNCKCHLLLPELRQSLPISGEDFEELNEIKNEKNQCRKLLIYLLGRGPNAFNKLLDALYTTGQMTAFKRVAPDNYVAPSTIEPLNNNKQFRAPDYIHQQMSEMQAPLDVMIKFASNFDYEKNHLLPTYNTTSINRGLVKIINCHNFQNQRPRVGSSVDVRNLRELFTQMGFVVDVVNDNPSKERIIKEIDSFANDRRLENADIAMLFVMSHGNVYENKEFIWTSDDRMIFTRDIENYFSNRNCSFMQNKPKLLFFQSCRGAQPDFGVPRFVDTDGQVTNRQFDTSTNTPSWSDLLIAHSTCPEAASHRDTVMGTWFIHLLCDVFMNRAHEMDVEDMLKNVQEKMRWERSAQYSMQTCEYTSRAFRKCYLNPGIYRGAEGQVCFFNLNSN